MQNDEYNKTMNTFHRHLFISIQNSKRMINVSNTKYPIVKEAALLLGFTLTDDAYHLLWTDQTMNAAQIRAQSFSTKVNHFPEITQITRKNKLANNLNNIKMFFPKEYNFYPETWVLPKDYYSIVKKHTNGKIYIVKPQNGCQGQGIYLLSNPSKLEQQSSCIVQSYIMNPLLINGLKFDMRIYVLITCINPLRVYLYKDGIVRFATDKFQKPKQQNLQNCFSHLTNYAINKLSKKFVVDQEDTSKNHKRLISDLFNHREKQELMIKVSKIIIKTIISGLPTIQKCYKQCKRVDPSSCFQLLGFDIILNQNKDPILLEVNQNSSLFTETKLDRKLKLQLVTNILQIVTPTYNPYHFDKIQNNIKSKDKHQMNYKGNFQKIYPCQTLEETEQYDMFMHRASTIFQHKFKTNTIKRQNPSQQYHIGGFQKVSLPWHQNPLHYTQQKVSKVYGARLSKTSNVKKRVVLN